MGAKARFIPRLRCEERSTFNPPQLWRRSGSKALKCTVSSPRLSTHNRSPGGFVVLGSTTNESAPSKDEAPGKALQGLQFSLR